MDYKIGIDEIYLTIENKVYQSNYLFSFILKESKYFHLYQTLYKKEWNKNQILTI